jgi:hypothetical protein
MENELDLTKILKVGDKVYSTIGGDGVVECIQSDNYPIGVKFKGISLFHGKDGKYSPELDGECVLFPSKDQRDWSKFKRPVEFKPGQLVLVWDNKEVDEYFNPLNAQIGIFKRLDEKTGKPVASLHIHEGSEEGVMWDHCEPFNVEEYLKQQSEQ